MGNFELSIDYVVIYCVTLHSSLLSLCFTGIYTDKNIMHAFTSKPTLGKITFHWAVLLPMVNSYLCSMYSM